MKNLISIPNPCGENWDEMTPTQKGAFCSKCQIEVVDFTGMSPEEIKTTLMAKQNQKTCGHISAVQLEMVNTDFHIWENQPASRFRSKFLYACLMVFGLTLFTGCEEGGDDEVMGDMEYHEDTIDGGIDVDDSLFEMLEGEIQIDDSLTSDSTEITQ